MNQYQKAFENMNVPSDMLERIQDASREKAKLTQNKVFFSLKKIRKMSLVASLLLIGIIGWQFVTPQNTNELRKEKSKVQIANPIKEFQTMEDLEKSVSFQPEFLNQIPSNYKISSMESISGDLVQIIYSDDTNEVVYRTSTKLENISGVYDQFEDSSVVANGITYTFSQKEGMVYVVTWTKDEKSYSLYFEQGVGIDVAKQWIDPRLR